MRKCLLLALVLITALYSQAQRTCGTMSHDSILQQSDVHYSAHRQEIERFMQDYVSTHPQPQAQRSVITIPVVVHVVYSDSAGDISTAQIQSQIDRMNLDYHKLNADTASVPTVWKSLIADCNIQFCLAQRDPNGAATTGIVRVRTSTTSFSTNDAVKYTSRGGSDAWPAGSYLNIWVCNLGGGLLGYSQFPGGAAATDGCVILNTAFGSIGTASTAPYNKGRTVTHEVGHWMNLYHTWGDDNGACTGSDQVNDTPNEADATYGCPTYPMTDACSATSPGVMFMNYMDYTDDACMYMFTNGQNARIQANFASGGPRASIVNSLGCQSVNPGPSPAFVANKTSVCVGQSVNFTDQSTGSPTSWSWSFTGGTPSTSTAQNPTGIVYSAPGTYTVVLTVSNSLGTNSLTKTAYITVLGTTALPLKEGFQTTTFVPTGWTLSNPDNLTAWTRATNAGGYGTSTASAYFNNFSSNNRGQKDYMYTPIYDFTYANSLTKLKFDYAYQLDGITGDNDTLQFIYSTDCGATWNSLWKKGGSSLTTVTTTNSNTAFVPTATQWKSDSVSLASLAGQPAVQFGVVNICNYGQSIYVDNINIDTPLCNRAAAPSSVTLPTAPCTGATAVYTVPAVSGATSYTWSVSGTGWSGTSTTNSITLTAGTGAGTVSVTANNACGSSAAYTFTAPHGAGPAAPTSVTLPSVTPCSGASATYTVPAVSGATSYTWTVSGTGWSGTSTTNSITLTAGTAAANVSVTANNSCASSTAYTFTAPVNTIPAAPTTVTLPTPPCANGTATYTIPAVSGATSYTWSVSGTGWSGTSSTRAITLTAGTGSASVSVTANNACGSSAPYVFTATSGALPGAATSISQPSLICSGQSVILSTPTIQGATSYNWSVNGTGWTGSSTTNSITLTAGTGPLNVSVSGVNACGAGQSFSLSNVPVLITPQASFTINNHSVGVTNTVSIVFTGSAPAGTTYSWNFDGGSANPGTGAGPQTVSWNTVGTKNVSLTLDNGGCTSSAFADTVQVNKTTGINSISVPAIDAMNIIPNPSSGLTNIILNATTESTVNLSVYDMTGRLVATLYNGVLEAGEKTIVFNTDNITSGIYLIKATDGNSAMQKRFVKM